MRKSGFDVGLETPTEQSVFNGLSMDEHGQWYDQQGNRIDNPKRDPNLRNVADKKSGQPKSKKIRVDAMSRNSTKNGYTYHPPRFVEAVTVKQQKKYREMSAKEALLPVAKYAATKTAAGAADIGSIVLKNPAGAALGIAGSLGGILAEQIKRDYLKPQSKKKKGKVKRTR